MSQSVSWCQGRTPRARRALIPKHVRPIGMPRAGRFVKVGAPTFLPTKYFFQSCRGTPGQAAPVPGHAGRRGNVMRRPSPVVANTHQSKNMWCIPKSPRLRTTSQESVGWFKYTRPECSFRVSNLSVFRIWEIAWTHCSNQHVLSLHFTASPLQRWFTTLWESKFNIYVRYYCVWKFWWHTWLIQSNLHLDVEDTQYYGLASRPSMRFGQLVWSTPALALVSEGDTLISQLLICICSSSGTATLATSCFQVWSVSDCE
jgi:hypothetical protein